MPEGDTIFRTARTLQAAIGGREVTRFESVLPKLERVDYDTPLAGRRVEKVEAKGKWLLMYFTGDLILLTHMLMSGSWHIYRPGERWQRPRGDMRIVIETDAMVAVAFNVPVAEFHTAHSLARRQGLNQLGPSALADNFDAEKAIANLASRPDLELGLALLDQRLIAGVGNFFKNEVAYACGISPFQMVGTLSRMQLEEVVATSRRLLRDRPAPKVYGRAGEPCRRCGTPIRSAKHRDDGRISFWCPLCQT